MMSFIKKVVTQMAVMTVASLFIGVLILLLFAVLGRILEKQAVEISDNSVLVLDLSANISDSPRELEPLDLIRGGFKELSTRSLTLKSLVEKARKMGFSKWL